MVNVYLMDVSKLEDPIGNPELLSQISNDRKEKILRYKQLKDRKQCFGAGLLIKKCLEERKFSENQIYYGENGKPQIEGIFFNISHSEDLVVCAVSDEAVGCDIEKVKKIRDGIAERFYTKEEIAYLEKVDEAKKTSEFYRIWTIKESYLKMTGEGLRVAPGDFDVLIDESVKIRRQGEFCSCHLKEWEIADYRLAVCSQSEEFEEYLNWIEI